MAVSPKHNPITIRLERLQSDYFNFRDREKARLCRWLVEPDEVELLNAFVRVENANEAQTNDLFIRFRSPFEQAETYTQSLVAELDEVWKTYQEHLSQSKTTNGVSSIGAKDAASPYHFLNRFDAFSRQLPNFEGLAVAFIFPDEISSPNKLGQWLHKTLEAGIPERVRLMVVDLTNNPFLDGVAAAFPDKVFSIRPNLDMPAAMRQLAATGDPKDPGVQFRKLFMELNQHAAKGSIEEMNRLGERAIAIAARENWMYLQVATYIAMGSGHIAKSQTDQALAVYDKAKQTAQTAWEAGDKMGAKLLTQTLLIKGSLLLGKKDYPAAGKLYRDAVAPATDIQDHFSMMEAWRMAGFCHEMNREYREAWECDQKALDAGEQLDENLRPNCTLPYVGQALLRLCSKVNFHVEEKTVRQRMETLCGADWEKALSKKGGHS